MTERSNWSWNGPPSRNYRKKHGLPRRHAAHWNDAEERAMFHAWLQGTRIKMLANIHLRKIDAMRQRLERVLVRMGLFRRRK